MAIIYTNEYRYVAHTDKLFIVVGAEGRIMITEDFDKAVLCCDGVI